MALSFTEGSIGGDIERISLDRAAGLLRPSRIAAIAASRRRRARASRRARTASPSRRKLTADGHALLLINPHTSFFFRSELQMTSDEGLNAYGASTWGQFFIYQGFNAKAGWMHTSTGVDNVDEFAETIVHEGRQAVLSLRQGAAAGRPRGPSRCRYRASRRHDGRRDASPPIATHHGPIVREADGKWIAIALMKKPVRGARAELPAHQGHRSTPAT